MIPRSAVPSPVVPPPPAEASADGRRLIVGRVIGDKYGVTGLIGEGGMGAVYEAEHLAIGRLVAVKVLHPRHAQKRDASTRLHHEARVAGTIGHPNICEIYDIGRLDDGSPYLVMERLHGESLAERIQREGWVRHSDLSEIMVQVLSALVVAHEKGIVHRDLKPDNIFLSQRAGMPPIAKLLDFGISKADHIEDTAIGLTKTGMVMGTPYYMAPEQARGDRTLDHRVDLWAVGVVLYEALSGRRPFVARNYNALLVQILTSKHRPLKEIKPEVPGGLCEIVDKALSKMREDRYQTAREFQEQLLRFCGAGSRSSVPPAIPVTQTVQASEVNQAMQAVQAAQGSRGMPTGPFPERSAPTPAVGPPQRLAPTPAPPPVQERPDRRVQQQRGRRATDNKPVAEPIWETSARGSVQVAAMPPPVKAQATLTSAQRSNALGNLGFRGNVSSGAPSPGTTPPPGNVSPSNVSPGVAPSSSRVPGVAPSSSRVPGVAPSSSRVPGVAPPSSRSPGVVSSVGKPPISVSPSSISQSHSISVDISVSEAPSSFSISSDEATVDLPGGAMQFHDSMVDEETPALLPATFEGEDIELTVVDPPKFLADTATLVASRRVPPSKK
jgi:eukaryotic-like serine/threonine-protein kinase